MSPGLRGPVVFLLLACFAVVAPTLGVSGVAKAETGAAALYPCSSCHATLNLTGFTESSLFHGINLTVGAHRGLYCASCHSASSNFDVLKGGVPLALVGLNSTSELKATNAVCGVCHPQELADYNRMAHGNSTFRCPGGSAEKIIGYKGVAYIFHNCTKYEGLRAEPAKACVECHDPHNPTLKPLSILPKQSRRPPVPDETPLVYGGLAVFLASIALIAVGARRG